MSVIIRLQNLPWSANASDVRAFFRGLGIPDGGVHIVGGENGDAFIAFSTDEDARQAMMLNGSKLKETQVHLLLSSRAEMQKVIEAARQQTISFMNFSAQKPTIAPTAGIVPMPLHTSATMINGATGVVGLMDPQIAVATKPQPPIITSNSLSGILAQQMMQQHQIEYIRQQQNMPVLTSTSVRHDAYKSLNNQYNSISHQYGDSAIDSNGKNDLKRSRNSRSRSRSRDRRDRRRSRSRERSRRYRDRSRSRERRRRRRNSSSDRRSRSRGRDRGTRDDVRKDRSYEKDVRSSLDRNKTVEENKINFNSTMENSFNAQVAQDHPKSSNVDLAGSTNNGYNNEPKEVSKNPFKTFNNQSRNDYPANIILDIEPAVGMVPYKESDNTNNNSSCIRITNLNARTHYAAIRKFFHGFQIPNDGIKLLNDETGKRRNEVAIRFVRPDVANDALALDGKMLNGSYVRIQSISDGEYENEVDSYQPPRRNTGRFGNRIDDRNNGSRGGSEESNSRDFSSRRNNIYEKPNQRNRFNDDFDGPGALSNDSRDRHNDDDDVMVITDSNDADTAPVGLTLLIEDLPPFAKEQDIIKMFSDFTLMDITLAKVNKMFRAYVKFHNQSDAAAALKQTHLHRIDFKSVFVSACSEETYEKAKREYDGLGDTIGKSEKDASNRDDPRSKFRNNLQLGDNEVDQFGRNIRNRKFVNPQAPDNKAAIPSLFNLTIDPPFVINQQNQQNEPKILLADPRLRRQFDQGSSQSSESQLSPNPQAKPFNPFSQPIGADPRLQRNSSLSTPNLTNNASTKLIFIGNVEYNTTESDILDFFADIGATPNRIFFVKNARGQPCGDCYVKFKTAEEATRALIKNRFRFRNRVIRVTLAETDDASKALGFSVDDDDAGDVDNSVNEIKDSTEGNSLEKNDNEMDLDGSNSDNQNAQHDDQDDDSNSLNNGRFDCGADDGCQFQRLDPRMYNAPYGRGVNLMGNNFFRGGRGGMPDSRNKIRGNYNQNNATRSLEGCVVSLNNVPFNATPRDIAEFFGEYNLGPSDIIRRFNDDGSLTGEARVRFLTPIDASE
ncbi:RNA-binding protein 12, partial [Pseudolycoriella hygida]